MAEVVFCARGVSKVYRVGEIEVHALRDVDLDLYRSEFVVLLGPSGSGKSTLLNILGGLDVPTHGRGSFLGHDLGVDDERALTAFRRKHVGFVFQFYNLIPRWIPPPGSRRVWRGGVTFVRNVLGGRTSRLRGERW